MKSLYPLFFEFDKLTAEPITTKSLEMYLFVARQLIGQDMVSYPTTATSPSFSSICISKNTEQQDSAFMGRSFLEWCEQTTGLTTGNTLNDADSMIFVDTTGLNRDSLLLPLSTAINDILKNEPKDCARVILFVKKMPNREDALLQDSFKLADEGKLIIVNKSGNLFGAPAERRIDKAELKRLRIGNIEDHRNKFAGKLIKKIGHFKIDKNRAVCSRFFYDGQYCDQELNILLENYLESNPELPGSLEYIFYSDNKSSKSPWLKKFISAFSGNLEVDRKTEYPNFKGCMNIDNIADDSKKNYTGGHILLVVDFINSGNTIRALISNLLGQFDILNSSRLKLVAIMNNRSSNIGNGERKRLLNVNGITYQIDAFLDVEQDDVGQSDCEKCKYGYKHEEEVDDAFIMFRSYDFWKLADQFKFEDEKFMPVNTEGEPRVQQVPSFQKWLSHYGPYLALKFKNYIEYREVNKQLNFAIIYPDEQEQGENPKTGTEQSASALFARKINEMFNINIIGIPRSVIDGVKRHHIKITDINNLIDAWKDRIVNMPPKTDVIILDEFYKDGGTLSAIRNILDWLNMPAKCFFSIADLNPKHSKGIADVPVDFKVLTLYELNYN